MFYGITVRLYRGRRYKLPTRIAEDRIVVTTDTREVFIGRGPNKPPKKLTAVKEISKIMAEGFKL